jgi:hypothetical protein
MRAASLVTHWIPMWRGSASGSWTESPHSGSRPGSRCGRGYVLHTTSQAGHDPNDVQLTTAIARSGAFALFALCAYGAMVVLGCCAIVVGALTFIDVRPAETSLIGSLAAIAFALPVLRNALPGSPPLGVQADMWVFLWTELATVLALALVVFKWARAGPPP